MSMDIRGIFDAITPENIKDIPLIATAMDIFIENIEENALLAESIRRIYTNEYNDSDSDLVKESKLNLRKGLLDVYMTSLYNVLSKAQNNEVVKAKLAQSGISDTPFFKDVERIISDEYFITNKAFKEKIGTNISIQYAYNLTKYLESAASTNDLHIQPIKPFHFRTDGSILKEMYENIVKPLAHPLGFTYEYNQIVEQSIQDLFGVDIVYNVYNIELRNLDGRFHVFTSDSNDDAIKANFLSRVNALTGRLFTLDEYNSFVTVFTNKSVDVFSDKVIDDRRFRSILFTDGTYLEQYTSPIEINYINYSDYLINKFDDQLFDYSGHWSLYVDYASDFNFTYADEITKVVMEFEISKIKENNGGAEGNKYYNLTSGEYAFKVGGNEYVYSAGLDESKKVYIDPTLVQNEINNKFNVTITGKTAWLDHLVVSIKDSYGNKVENADVAPLGTGDWSVVLNTYELNGDDYTITVSVTRGSTITKYSVKSNGLNNFDRQLAITNVEDANHVTPNTLKIEGIAPTSRPFDIVITDQTGAKVELLNNTTLSGSFSYNVDISTLSAGNFTIVCSNTYANGKPWLSSFYSAPDLKTHINDIQLNAKLFSYVNGSPNYVGKVSSTTVTTATMVGINSTSSYVIKQIGELSVDNTYCESDKYLLNYMIDNGITSIANIPDTIILNGAYIEGSNYDLSNSSILAEEETFINYGRRIYPINTSDFIVVTSSDYCTDDFLSYGLSTTGYYLYTDELTGYDYYFYTNDGFYMTTYGDNV